MSDVERKQQKFVNHSFALDVFITEIERLRQLGQKFLLVHSPSRTELANLHLINENEILRKMQEMYPNDILMLQEFLQKAFDDNHPKLFRDDVHYEEEGHRIIGEALSKRLSVLLAQY